MAEPAKNPSVEDIWSWLHDVPDPEIPVISVVDLGIVREVAWAGKTLVVTVTPTYTGCPATAVINKDIEKALRRQGVDDVRIETRLSPAWTTAWISDEGRNKLKAFGIAPPVEGAMCPGALNRPASISVECPRCGSPNTQCVSPFGSTPCKANYRCNECLEPFDYFKSF